MKKALAIFLAFIIGLSMSAQIQNKLLGFTLGTTTKAEVYNKYKNESNFIADGDEYYLLDTKFAGSKWDLVSFYFFHNKLAGVSFADLEHSTPMQLMESIWTDLKDKLRNKYSNYLIPTSPDMILYSDGITNVSLKLTDLGSSGMGLILYYSNRALTEGKMDEEEGEL